MLGGGKVRGLAGGDCTVFSFIAGVAAGFGLTGDGEAALDVVEGGDFSEVCNAKKAPKAKAQAEEAIVTAIITLNLLPLSFTRSFCFLIPPPQT